MIKPITRNRGFNPASGHMFKVGIQKNGVQEGLEILGCLVVIARHGVPKQSLKAIVRLLRFARNDRMSW